MKLSLKLLAAACFAAVSAPAQAQVVDFSGDFVGTHTNPFFSTSSSLVSFSTASGASFFQVADWGIQSHGNGLGLWNNGNPFALIMNFVTPMSFLSVGFGNDDTCCGPVGMNVFLRVYSGSTLLGTTSVIANMNDVMDQTISISSSGFDRAELQYGTAGLAIIADDVTFDNRAVVATPEPASLALLATGLVAVGGVVRRRRKV